MSAIDYPGKLKADLLDALNKIKLRGDFAASYDIADADFEDPGLEVEGIGAISLPMSQEKARELILKTQQLAASAKNVQLVESPPGIHTGDSAIFDFKFTNLRWESFLQQICVTAGKELGATTELKAQLHEISFSQPGAPSSRLQASPVQRPDAFGTLAICLPSAHQGGDVVLDYNDQSRIFASSRARQSFVCWRSHVSHQVLPVLAGCRCALTYLLTTTETAAESVRRETRDLHHVLNRWFLASEDTGSSNPGILDPGDSDKGYRYLYYGLEHDDASQVPSLAILNQVDEERVRALIAMSNELPIEVLFAVVSKKVLYTAGCSATTEISQEIYGLEGNHLTSSTLNTEDLFIQDSFFAKDSQETWDYGSRKNDERCLMQTSVVIALQTALVDLLVPRVKARDRKALISYLVRTATEPSRRRISLTVLKGFCAKTMDLATLEVLLCAAMDLEDWELFAELARSQTEGSQGDQDRCDSSFLRQVRGRLERTPKSFEAIKDCLRRVVLSRRQLADRLTALQNIASDRISPPTSTLGELVGPWARDTFSQAWDTNETHILGETDGKLLAKSIIIYCQNPQLFLNDRYEIPQFLLNAVRQAAYPSRAKRLQTNCFLDDYSIMPRILAKPAETSFIIVFFVKLQKNRANLANSLWHSGGLWHSKGVTAKIIAGLDVLSLRYLQPPRSRDQGEGQQAKKNTISRIFLTKFMLILSSPDTDGGIFRAFCAKFDYRAVSQISRVQFNMLWVPSLQRLTTLLSRRLQLSPPSTLQNLFRAILSSYITTAVGASPTTSGPTYSPGGCNASNCNVCAPIRSFLLDPDRGVGCFQTSRCLSRTIKKSLDAKILNASFKYNSVPETIVLTKVVGEEKKKRKVWASRKARALAALGKFDQPMLKTLLGDSYESIRTVQMTQPPPLPLWLAPPKLTAGVKRKADEQA